MVVEVHVQKKWYQWGLFSFRLVFIGGKCLAMIYKDILFTIKFMKTYQTWMQFEIIYFISSAILIAVVLPIIFIKEINTLFYCFIVNSILRYSLSHILFMRTNITRYEPVRKVRLMRFYILIKLGILCTFISSPLIN